MRKDNGFKRITEQEMKDRAEKEAGKISIRSYVNGSSIDTWTESTDEEKQIIANILYSAFLTLSRYTGLNDWDAFRDGVLDMAEFTANLFMKGKREDGERMNGFDTIYRRIEKFCADYNMN